MTALRPPAAASAAICATAMALCAVGLLPGAAMQAVLDTRDTT